VQAVAAYERARDAGGSGARGMPSLLGDKSADSLRGRVEVGLRETCIQNTKTVSINANRNLPQQAACVCDRACNTWRLALSAPSALSADAGMQLPQAPPVQGTCHTWTTPSIIGHHHVPCRKTLRTRRAYWKLSVGDIFQRRNRGAVT